MIINTGGRTDTVHYYTPWLLNRFKEGFVYVRNPMFPEKIAEYSLNPETVDCVLFCSKNYEPILPYIKNIGKRFNVYCCCTITAYGKDIEPNVPSIMESIKTLTELSNIIGRNRTAWRYDPVLLTQDYTISRHLAVFEEIAAALAGRIDRCIFSFAEMYKKVSVNMPELGALTSEEMNAAARGLGSIAAKYGIPIQTCGTNESYASYGIMPSGCITLNMLGRANGVQFKELKHRGMRKGCGCIESRDIGAYDSCISGCRYCYANTSLAKAIANHSLHNPDSPMLIGELMPGEQVRRSVQKSFILQKENTLRLDL